MRTIPRLSSLVIALLLLAAAPTVASADDPADEQTDDPADEQTDDSPDDPADDDLQEVDVVVSDDGVDPMELEVATGTTVTWLFTGNGRYGITFVDSGLESAPGCHDDVDRCHEPDATFQLTFEEPGEHWYRVDAPLEDGHLDEPGDADGAGQGEELAVVVVLDPGDDGVEPPPIVLPGDLESRLPRPGLGIEPVARVPDEIVLPTEPVARVPDEIGRPAVPAGQAPAEPQVERPRRVGVVPRPATGLTRSGRPPFPAHLKAMQDSVQRTPAGSTAPLLAIGAEHGLTDAETVELLFGRFPVGGRATWTHDWWFPRWGPSWRLHQGIDIFAAAGTPVRAPAAGTVRITSGGLGGLAVHVTEPDGTRWYLAHLSRVADGLASGDTVQTGQVVGAVGDSGNARGGPPHLHLGYRPGGGANADPKPVVDQMLADAIDAAPAVLAERSAASEPSARASAVRPLRADVERDPPPRQILRRTSSPDPAAIAAAPPAAPWLLARSEPVADDDWQAVSARGVVEAGPPGVEMLLVSGLAVAALLTAGRGERRRTATPR